MQVVKPDYNDFAAIAAIFNKAVIPFHEIYSDEEVKAYADSMVETANTISDLAETREVLCIREGEVIAGFAAFRKKNDHVVWISYLYVDPACQRKGMGRALLSGVEIFSNEKGCDVLALETHPKADWAISFYLKNGFRIVNDMMAELPYSFILDKPPVPGRPVLAKRI